MESNYCVFIVARTQYFANLVLDLKFLLNIPRLHRSYAAIQARVKRELELERKAQQSSEEAETVTLREQRNKIEDPSIFAVTDVFFRCPYLSDEVLSRDEWKKKIREFLYEQLKGEEAGLTACLIIQSCNSGREKIDGCVDTLGKYLDNIVNNPSVDKYWKIRMCNKIFQVMSLPSKQFFVTAKSIQTF